MEREDDETVDTETAETTETEETTVDEATEESAETAEADGIETEEKLPKDAPEWAVKRFGKLTAKRHAAEEAQAQAETDRDQYKTEAETAKAKYGDREILLTAKRTGILPELLTKDEAATLNQADKLERDIEQLEAALDDNPDGWTAGDQTVTAGQAKGWLRKAKGDLKEIADEAAQIRKSKADEVRELIRLGKEAKKSALSRVSAVSRGSTGGVKPVPKAKPTAGATQTQTQTGVRRAATDAPDKGGGDLSKVKTQDDMLKYLTRKHGG
jgi:hypothetical protein